jgi:hypothetical protein
MEASKKTVGAEAPDDELQVVKGPGTGLPSARRC